LAIFFVPTFAGSILIVFDPTGHGQLGFWLRSYDTPKLLLLLPPWMIYAPLVVRPPFAKFFGPIPARGVGRTGKANFPRKTFSFPFTMQK